MSQTRRKKRTPRGTATGGRDRTKSRIEARLSDPRVQSRLEEARASQRVLEARQAAEQAEAARLDRERTAELQKDLAATLSREQTAIARQRRGEELLQLRDAMQKRAVWPLSEARNLIRDGYTLKSTVRRTGWPEEMLADVRPGVW